MSTHPNTGDLTADKNGLLLLAMKQGQNQDIRCVQESWNMHFNSGYVLSVLVVGILSFLFQYSTSWYRQQCPKTNPGSNDLFFSQMDGFGLQATDQARE
jgi:hypothetical protein